MILVCGLCCFNIFNILWSVVLFDEVIMLMWLICLGSVCLLVVLNKFLLLSLNFRVLNVCLSVFLLLFFMCLIISW